MDTDVNRRFTGQYLSIGVQDKAGELVGYVIAFGIGAAEGESLGNSVTAKEMVNSLGL